ncbi:MAG TPA: hypothetical protein VN930_08610 [Xanthobacteraceae bacterium]|nr:hypothetical protein [Xanthobacteraceae bacterium]
MSWFFALLFLTGVAFAQSQPEPQPQSKTSPLSEQQRTPQPTPPINLLTSEQITKAIADGIDTAAKKYEGRHPATPPDNSSWWTNFLLVFFTGGLVVVGGVKCFLIFWTLEATNIAANAAKNAAEHIPRVERPYVLVRNTKARIPPGPPWPDAVPRHVLVDINFRNYGKTPANISLAQILVQVLDHIPTGEDASRTINDPAAKSEISVVLGSSDSDRDWPLSNIPSDEPVTPQSLHQLTDGTKHLYCWGKVLYRDIFGKENPTEFCLRYDMKRKEFGPVGGFERNKST